MPTFQVSLSKGWYEAECRELGVTITARRLEEIEATARRTAAREDTVLFPALHALVSRAELDALGEDFERRERAAFGEDGFEHAVARVDAIEKTVGLEDLASFTPKA